MKRLSFILCLATSVAAGAQNLNDTVVNLNGSTVAINSNDGKTTVKVYDKKGNELVKTRETEYVDGQEVERVYVGSPFLRASALQKVQLFPDYYYVDAGWVTASAGAFKKAEDADNLYLGGAYTFGFGMNCIAIPFGKSLTSGLTIGLGMKYVKYNVQDNMKLTKLSRGSVAFGEMDRDARKNCLEYGAITLPVMLNATGSRYSKWNIGVGLAPEFRYTSQYVFTPHSGATERTKGVVNTFGLNAEMMCNLSPITVRLSYDLLPAFKTDTGFKAHTASITLGVDIMSLGKLIHKGK